MKKIEEDHPILKRVEWLIKNLQIQDGDTLSNWGKIEISKLRDFDYEKLYSLLEALEALALQYKQEVLVNLLKVHPEYNKDN